MKYADFNPDTQDPDIGLAYFHPGLQPDWSVHQHFVKCFAAFQHQAPTSHAPASAWDALLRSVCPLRGLTVDQDPSQTLYPPHTLSYSHPLPVRHTFCFPWTPRHSLFFNHVYFIGYMSNQLYLSVISLSKCLVV